MATQLELFRATCAHEPHEEFLYYAGFTPDLHRRIKEDLGLGEDGDVGERLGFGSAVGVGMRWPEDWKATDFSGYFEDVEKPDGARINSTGVLEIPANFYHFTGYISPLRNAQRFEELESFPYPNTDGHTEDHMAGAVEDAHANGRSTTCWVGHMYESSWQIRGYEQFLEDSILRPEWCEYILDRLTERNMTVACAAARAGVDMLHTGDDVATQVSLVFSPENWRRLMKSRWAKVYAAARAIKPDIEIWYHSDGNVDRIVPELVEIGVTLLNPVQPECMDPVKVKRECGDRLVLDGTIGTQSTMPFGSAQEVKNVVRERVRTLGGDGALILSPTHVLEPEVPLENIYAFVEAARSSKGI